MPARRSGGAGQLRRCGLYRSCGSGLGTRCSAAPMQGGWQCRGAALAQCYPHGCQLRLSVARRIDCRLFGGSLGQTAPRAWVPAQGAQAGARPGGTGWGRRPDGRLHAWPPMALPPRLPRRLAVHSDDCREAQRLGPAAAPPGRGTATVACVHRQPGSRCSCQVPSSPAPLPPLHAVPRPQKAAESAPAPSRQKKKSPGQLGACPQGTPGRA